MFDSKLKVTTKFATIADSSSYTLETKETVRTTKVDAHSNGLGGITVNTTVKDKDYHSSEDRTDQILIDDDGNKIPLRVLSHMPVNIGDRVKLVYESGRLLHMISTTGIKVFFGGKKRKPFYDDITASGFLNPFLLWMVTYLSCIFYLHDVIDKRYRTDFYDLDMSEFGFYFWSFAYPLMFALGFGLLSLLMQPLRFVRMFIKGAILWSCFVAFPLIAYNFVYIYLGEIVSFAIGFDFNIFGKGVEEYLNPILSLIISFIIYSKFYQKRINECRFEYKAKAGLD